MNEHAALPRSEEGDHARDATACRLPEQQTIEIGRPDPLGDIVTRVLIKTDWFVIYSVSRNLFDARDATKAATEAQDTGRAGEDRSFAANLGRVLGSGSGKSEHVWLRTQYPADYARAKELRAKLAEIAIDLAHICDMVDSICQSGSLDAENSASLRRRATEMMARAMEMAYEGNAQGARLLLESLRNHITTLRDSKNRMLYVHGNLLALIGILLLWAALRISGVASSLVIAGAEGGFDLVAIDILALGAVGAFFSVSASVSSIRVNHSVTFREMTYTGFVRIPIGVIASGVAIFLISGDWLLASIQPELLPWSYLLFGFLAGFSELFVPNALKQVEAASTVGLPDGARPG